MNNTKHSFDERSNWKSDETGNTNWNQSTERCKIYWGRSWNVLWKWHGPNNSDHSKAVHILFENTVAMPLCGWGGVILFQTFGANHCHHCEWGVWCSPSMSFEIVCDCHAPPFFHFNYHCLCFAICCFIPLSALLHSTVCSCHWPQCIFA